MCYAKPGPRCSSHAERSLEVSKRVLADAEASGDEGRIARARAAKNKATMEWLVTTEGIALTSANDPRGGEILLRRREHMLGLMRKISRCEALNIGDKIFLAEHGSHDQMMRLVPVAVEDAGIGLSLVENGNDEIRDALRNSPSVVVRRMVAVLASDDVRRRMVDDENESVRAALSEYGGEEIQELLGG